MGTSAKRHFRALVASAIFGAVLGLGSGPAAATLFEVNFDSGDPTSGVATQMFTIGVFTFECFACQFTFAPGQGEGGSDGIMTFSFDDSGTDSMDITFAGGFFIFDSIFIDDLASTGISVSAVSGDTVNVVTLTGAPGQFFDIIFDTFKGEFLMVPEPSTVALFVTGLFGLGLLSRRRRQS